MQCLGFSWHGGVGFSSGNRHLLPSLQMKPPPVSQAYSAEGAGWSFPGSWVPGCSGCHFPGLRAAGSAMCPPITSCESLAPCRFCDLSQAAPSRAGTPGLRAKAGATVYVAAPALCTGLSCGALLLQGPPTSPYFLESASAWWSPCE